MGLIAIAFAVDVLISTICIWLATKLSFVKIEPKIIAFIVVVVAVVSLIPMVGWVAGLALFVYLLIKASDCSMVDAIWVVLFSKLISFFAVITVVSFVQI